MTQMQGLMQLNTGAGAAAAAAAAEAAAVEADAAAAAAAASAAAFTTAAGAGGPAGYLALTALQAMVRGLGVTKISDAIINLFQPRVATAFVAWRESLVANLPNGTPATIDAYWIARQLDVDRWECREIRNVTSPNPTTTTGTTAYQLRGCQIRQAGGLIETDGTGTVIPTFTGTGWAAVTTGAQFAHNQNYYRTSVIGDACQFSLSGAAVRLRIRMPRLTNGGYATVAIGGSLTAATSLTTGQQEVDAGRMHPADLTTSALVTGSGGAIVSGSTSLIAVMPGAGFVPGDVGRKVTVPNAGAAGANLNTWVKTYVDATHVTVVNAASTTVVAKAVTFPAGIIAPTTRVQSFNAAVTDYTSYSDIVTGLAVQGPDRVITFTHTGAMPLSAVATQTSARTYLDIFTYMLTGASAATFAGDVNSRQVIDSIFATSNSSVYESAVIPSLTGGAQFIGGSHGFDQTDSLAIVVDGTAVNLTDQGNGVQGNSIAILRNDTWQDQFNPPTPIGKWSCVYSVNAGGFPVEWDRTMLVADTFSTSDVAMLPTEPTFTRSRNMSLPLPETASAGDGSHHSVGRCNAMLMWQPTGAGGGYAAIIYVPDSDQSLRGLPCAVDTAYVEDRAGNLLKKTYFTRADPTNLEPYAVGDHAHGSMVYAVQHFADPEALFGSLLTT